MSIDERTRLDRYLVEARLSVSRERARAAIMAGQVYVDGRRIEKAGFRVDPGAQVEVRGNDLPYVSRGGLKLASALDEFQLSVEGLVCMDVGASTGGFTDCLLQRGAQRVYAVDVGYGQLDWRLRSDERVVVMERTNARHLVPEAVPEVIEFLTLDVSFISLRKLLLPLRQLLSSIAKGVALVKPQFEAGRQDVGKGGVVRERAVHVRVLNALVAWLPEVSLRPLHLTFSPVKGPKGNVEFLLGFTVDDENQVAHSSPDWEAIVERTVNEAHTKLRD